MKPASSWVVAGEARAPPDLILRRLSPGVRWLLSKDSLNCTAVQPIYNGRNANDWHSFEEKICSHWLRGLPNWRPRAIPILHGALPALKYRLPLQGKEIMVMVGRTEIKAIWLGTCWDRFVTQSHRNIFKLMKK